MVHLMQLNNLSSSLMLKIILIIYFGVLKVENLNYFNQSMNIKLARIFAIIGVISIIF
jgi:hypothetical protein